VPVVEDACLPPDKEICTPSGWRPIVDISVGDSVLGSDGDFHTVTRVMKRNYTGDIVTLTPWSMGFPVSATPEHPVLACKAYRGNGHWVIRPTFDGFERYGKAARYYKRMVSWVPIGTLTVGDFGLIPMPAFVVRPQLEIERPAIHAWNMKMLPTQLELTEGLLYLCGLYIAEGSAARDCVQVSNADGRIVEEYSSAMSSSFGVNCTILDRGRLYESRAFSVPLYRLFRGWFGEGARSKRIPAWIMGLPSDLLGPFIRGLWDGDGSSYLSPHGRKVFAYRTVSRQLARQVCLLLLKRGIVSVLVSQNDAYDIRIQSDHSGRKLSGILRKEWNQGKSTSRSTACFIHDGYLWIPIRDARRVSYCGPVHDLEVDSVHSYMSEFTMFHNCQAPPVPLRARSSKMI
jgi:LAGLIDADG-like domain